MDRKRKVQLILMCLLAALSAPYLITGLASAANNVHTFFLGNTVVDTCTIDCRGYATSSGAADTTTTQSVSSTAPTRDSNANSFRTGTWSSGTSFTITSVSTNGFPDIIVVWVVTSGTITVSSLSASGVTFDGSARQSISTCSNAHTDTEWIGRANAALSAVTFTVNLSGTPTAASGEVFSMTGIADPTTTFTPFDKASGLPATAQAAACGTSSTPTVTGPTSLSARDIIVAFFASSTSVTETAGTGFTLDLTVASGASLAVEHIITTATVAQACAFGTSTTNWRVTCDYFQAAPKYYKVDPFTGGSTVTGTPSITSVSGAAWVVNTDGLATHAINDIQAGTWQIDQTIAISSVTGAPVGRLWVTAWSCTTNGLGTCTNIWTDWDIATNVLASATATKYTLTTASVSQINTPHFLSIEYWIVFQYSGSTTSRTVTHTTVSSASDILTPGWDSTVASSAPVTVAGSIDPAVLTRSGGSVTCNLHSALKDCFSTRTAAVTIGNSVARVAGFFRDLAGAITAGDAVSRFVSFFRALAASVTITGAVGVIFTGGGAHLTRDVSASVTVSDSAQRLAGYFRNLSAPTAASGSPSRLASLFKTLSASAAVGDAVSRVASFFRGLTAPATIGDAASRSLGKTISLSAPVTASDAVARAASFLRGLTAPVTASDSASRAGLFFRAALIAVTVASAVDTLRAQHFFRDLSASVTIGGSSAIAQHLSRALAAAILITPSIFTLPLRFGVFATAAFPATFVFWIMFFLAAVITFIVGGYSRGVPDLVMRALGIIASTCAFILSILPQRYLFFNSDNAIVTISETVSITQGGSDLLSFMIVTISLLMMTLSLAELTITAMPEGRG